MTVTTTTTRRMPNADFIAYLNSLHSAKANNQNAIAELNITNPFYAKTMVERAVGRHIQTDLENRPAHIFILTGHAGDGKTGLLFQVLQAWGVMKQGEKLEVQGETVLPSGKSIRYVKDFSELTAEERLATLNHAAEDCRQGISTFLVANTGPLINSFEQFFQDPQMQLQFIEQIDINDGEMKQYNGIPVAAINIANTDNSIFVEPFLKNLLGDELWRPCQYCEKRQYCVVYSNRRLLQRHSDKAIEFIRNHYIFQQEYGEKLTIRQIVAHLSFTITGGLECANIKNSEAALFNYLLSNNFFGYKGIKRNPAVASLKAITDITRAGYDAKRLRIDETLFVKGNLADIFSQEVSELLLAAGAKYYSGEEWQRAVRRACLMLNVDTSLETDRELQEDVFSLWFPRYLQLRSLETAKGNPGGKENELIHDALQMIFTESIASKEKDIPVTMKRENGVMQNVQLVYDLLQKKKVRMIRKGIIDHGGEKRYRLYVTVDGERLGTPISLPLMDYFEDIRKGVIPTNVDPMLSQGIDSLKAEIISLCQGESTELNLLVMSNTSKDSGWDSITAAYENGIWTIS